MEQEEPQVYILICKFITNPSKEYEYRAFGVMSELEQCSHAVISRKDYTSNARIENALLDKSLEIVEIKRVVTLDKQKYDGTLKFVVDTIDPTIYLQMTREAS